MAMNLPSVKPRPLVTEAFSFPSDMDGNMMAHPMTARSQIAPKHPAQHLLLQAKENEELFHRSALMMAQGPAGPMMIGMELRAANSVGRLPFLQGSHFQRDVLTGKDEEIDFDDIFAMNPRIAEHTVNPHTVMDQAKHKFSF